MTRFKEIATACAIVLACSAVAFAWLFGPSETQPREPDRSPQKVRVISPAEGPIAIHVESRGRVSLPAPSPLSSRIASTVIEVSPALHQGAFFKRGELLLRLDSSDFALAVEMMRAKVAEAELQLSQEQAESRLAERDFEAALSKTAMESADPLALRRPQLARAEAALAAARAELRIAQLELERCRIVAPFDGRVEERLVGVGQFVGAGQDLAVIQPTGYAEVRLPVAQDDLSHLDLTLDGGSRQQLRARLKGQLAGANHRWPATVERTDGVVDDRTRMIHLVARVDRPYEHTVPLPDGLFVQATIEGRVAPSSMLIPRSALQDDIRVRLVDAAGSITTANVEVHHRRGDFAVIAGLEPGARIAVDETPLIADGTEVEVVEIEAPRPSDWPALDAFETTLTSSETATELAAELAAEPATNPATGRVIDTSSSDTSLSGTSPSDTDWPSPSPPETSTVALRDVEVEVGRIVLRLDAATRFDSFRLRAPERLVVDLEQTKHLGGRSLVEFASACCRRLRIGQFQPHTTRLVFDLHDGREPPEIDWLDARTLVVEVGAPAQVTAERSP